MQNKEKEIPIAPIDRIMHQEGAERVSEEAAKYLRDIIENIVRQIAREASELSKHAGRKTVTRDDIEFAVKRLYRKFTPAI